MKVFFLGTPEFAVGSLESLIKASNIEVLAVITQPDKAVGRQQLIIPPPIKVLAQQHQIPVFQPEKINLDQDLIELIKNSKPDFLITVAYGQIIKQELLNIAPIINVHASLLPDYRGPAPINWSLIHGETEVGVSTMLTDLGVDTGDILLKAAITIDQEINAAQLAEQLAKLGADLLIETLNRFQSIKPEKQTASLDSNKQLAPFMDKKLGEIDFRAKNLILRSANPKQSDFQVVKENSAINIHNLVRATYPWPGTYFFYEGKKVILLESKLPADKSAGTLQLGQISINKEAQSFSIQTQNGLLEIIKLKPEGKQEMFAYQWINGLRLKDNLLFKN